MAAASSCRLTPLLVERTTQQCARHSQAAFFRVRCSSDASSISAEASSLVPRRCNLKELAFTEDGRFVTSSPSEPTTGLNGVIRLRSSELLELVAATVEATSQVKDLETLSGRLSMVAFFGALAVESSTGSGIFSSLDQEGLQKALGLGLLAAMGAGAFAVAIRGKRNVTDILSSGCKRWMDSTVDSLVDALFFEESLVPHTVADDTARKQQ